MRAPALGVACRAARSCFRTARAPVIVAAEMEQLFRPVPPLVIPDEVRARLHESDVVVLRDLFKVGYEMSYHDKMTTDEPPLEYDISLAPRGDAVVLWILYPPLVNCITAAQTDAIRAFGRTHERYLDAHNIRALRETALTPERTSLAVTVPLHGSAEARVRERILIETTVEYRQLGAAHAPDGVAVRRQQTGTVFNNAPNQRAAKRTRIDFDSPNA